MKCSSALSTAPATSKALHEILEHLELKSAGECADLIMVFASMHHADELGRISLALKEKGLARHVLGCTGESIVGEDSEVEGSPALSVWSIAAPGLTLRPLRMEGPAEASLPWAHGLQDVEHAVLLFLGDPFSFEPDEFLKQVSSQVTGLRVVGGMASGSQVPRANQLVLDGEAFHDGAVAMMLGGPVSVRTVVSQGCRPIGHTMLVTRAERNIIRELGRRPALEVLREMFQELSEDDQRRLQDGLHIGRVINEYQGSFQRGDFLVRNVIGADDSGAIQITDLVRVGQTVQFHVRDAETADEDLRLSLLHARDKSGHSARPSGALLFSCNGRGTRLFGEPNHDVSLIHEIMGPIPVAGFFAMGEIGPIGGQNFLHGFTASVLLFDDLQ
jgi:small ligand-binding sensory domain FIST